MQYKQENVFKLTTKQITSNLATYHRFINWVSGEFDLYLQYESESLKVYLPEGCFKIKAKQKMKQVEIEIFVKGKSKEICEYITTKLEQIYSLVVHFNSKNSK